MTTGTGLQKNQVNRVDLGFGLDVDFVVGNAGDVTAGLATHTSVQAAHDAASNGDIIKLLRRTITENVILTKEVKIQGLNNRSVIDGTLDLNAGASKSMIRELKVTGNITVASGVKNCILTDMWVSNGVIVTDNNVAIDDNQYIIKEEV